MADATGSSDGSGAAAADGTQSFAPAALRAGVKLQPGSQIKITVVGVSGKPLPGGRKPRYIAPPGSDGSGAGSGDIDPSTGQTNPGSSSGADASGDADHHVLAAEVHGIDGALLPGHGVRVYAADGGKLIGQGTTDENGQLHFDVPVEGDYNLELVDAPLNIDSGAGGGNDPVHKLRAIFTDGSGAPIPNETITVDTGDDSKFELTTDETGMAETSGPLRSYDLTIRGQKFTAHSLPAADHETLDNAFRFTVDGKGDAA